MGAESPSLREWRDLACPRFWFFLVTLGLLFSPLGVGKKALAWSTLCLCRRLGQQLAASLRGFYHTSAPRVCSPTLYVLRFKGWRSKESCWGQCLSPSLKGAPGFSLQNPLLLQAGGLSTPTGVVWGEGISCHTSDCSGVSLSPQEAQRSHQQQAADVLGKIPTKAETPI